MKNTDPGYLDFLRDICRGDEDAVRFLFTLTGIAHFWDDVIDQDPLPPRATLYDGMWASLVALPRDPFYRKWFAELSPLVTAAILDWRVANAMEMEGEPANRRISFIIRSSYVVVLQQTALIVGGPEWADRCGLLIREKAHGEGFDAYLKSLGDENGTV